MGWKIRNMVGMLAVCVWMTACFDNPEEDRDWVDVCFSPAVTPVSRTSQAIYPVTNTFGMWAYALPVGLQWGKHQVQAEEFISGEAVAYRNQVWQTEKEHGWSPDKSVSFFGWSPFELQASFTPENGVCFKNFDVLESERIPMFTNPIIDVSQPYLGAPVPVLFIHALAKVEFRAHTTMDSELQVYITNVRVRNMAHAGDFVSLPTPCWRADGQIADIDFLTSPVKVGQVTKSLGEGKWVLPQWMQQPVEVTYDLYDRDGNAVRQAQTVTTEPMCTEWEVGRLYIYTLKLDSDGVSFNTEILDNL